MAGFLSLRGLGFSSRSRTLKPSKARLYLFLFAFFFFSLAAGFPAEQDKIWAEEVLKNLSLRDKIAQLVQIRVPGKFINRNSPDFQALAEQVRRNRIGGVVLFAGDVYESAILLNELQTLSKVPLLVAADFERGLSFRIADTTSFPWTMALGATGSERYSYDQGLITGQEARALGVHWIFAPVVDVNNNPENPVINIRSFGEDPGLVARLGSAFIRGARKAGALTTAKHFPGHGDTSTDSHLGLAVVESDLARLQTVEFVPFKSAIEAGVDSIMTAHVAVPNLTDEPEIPATLSPKILTDTLRERLHFPGLIVTDALEMGGITNRYWCGLAAIRALQAGADILLLPPDANVAINEVERAVQRGDISENRINESVRRVLNAKARMGLHRNRTVSIRKIGDFVASPQSARLAQEIADHSITAVRDDQRLLPLDPLNDRRLFSLVLASDLESSPGSVFQTELRRHFPSVRTAWANARISEELLASIDKAASESDVTICSILTRLSTGQDAIGIPRSQQAILARLAALKKPLIWIALGSPYVLRLIPENGTYLCTFSYSDVSQIAAAKAIAGEIEITGRMPVSIPGRAAVGDGLQTPKLPMILHEEPPEIRAKIFEPATKVLDEAVRTGLFRRAQLLAGHRSSIVLDYSIGGSDLPGGSGTLSRETVYGLGSMSSVVGTASAAMLAIDSGILLPKSPAREYVPEAKVSEKLLVQDLLADTIGSHANLIQEIVSRAAGVPIQQFLSKNLFQPLGMTGLLRKSGNLFCRGRDLAIFSQMLLNRGMYDHRRFFKAETIAKYTGPRGLWSKASDSKWASGILSPSSFGHLSPAGAALWIDPAKQLFVILLTSPQDTKSAGKVDQTQRAIIESVMSQIANHE